MMPSPMPWCCASAWGTTAKALSDAALFRKYFAQKSPQKNAQIAFAIAAHYVESGKWDDARRQLASNMASVDRHAAYDTRVQAHAMLGHAYAELGQTSRAGDSYRRVVALWSDSDAAVAKIFESAKDEPEAVRVRRLGKALNSVGEALFFFAEQQRTRDVAPIRFPAYRGGGYHPPFHPPRPHDLG